MQSDSQVAASTDLQRILQRAVELHQAGRLAEAEPLYRRALQLDPRHAETLSMMGVLAAQSGGLQAAREFAKAAIAERPDHAGYRFNLAHVLHMAGDPGAAGGYREALELDPLHIPSLVNLGSLQLDLGRPQEAKDCFTAAAQADAKSVSAVEGLGLACQRQGQVSAAIEAFQRALSLDPASGVAQANLGGLLLEAGRHEDAVRQLRAALAAIPARADLHTNLGVALIATGQLRPGLAELETALRLQPSYSRALGMKGLALAENGEAESAAAIFDYDRFLAATSLTAVPTYADIAAFNKALAAEVLGHGSLKSDRANRVLRGGRQTGELFGGDGGQALSVLEQTAGQAVGAYLQMAESGGGYPLPVPPRWRLAATGIVLNSGGHLEAAQRPAGFLSGLYIVQLPQIPDHDGTNQGAVEFGTVPPNLGFADRPPARLLQPKEGMLLLFPAHFWHRTAPAYGDRPRIVIAFDALSQA